VAGGAARTLRRVTGFWEKPCARTASALMDRGCVWNTFVMAGSINAFLKVMRQALPDLFGAFQAIQGTLSTAGECAALSELYSSISSMSFCTEVLSRCPQDLVVLCGAGMGWSDLGEPDRVSSVVGRGRSSLNSLRPRAEEWPASVSTTTA